MASTRLKTDKQGRRFYEIQVSRGRGKAKLYHRWYIPDGWSKRAIESELKRQVSAFQAKVDGGEVISRAEAKAIAEAEAKTKEAEEAAAAAEAEKLKTLRQYATLVFMPRKELSIAENTRLSYWSNLNEHILPSLGDHLMKDITASMINAMLASFQKSHSYGSSVKVYNILNGIFGMAFRDDTIEINPMFKVEHPKEKKDEKAVTEADKALFEDELNRVLDCVKSEPLKWQAFIYLAADTGARRGELCGLKWSDIDLKKGTVSIRRNLQYSKAKKADEKDKTIIYDGVYVVTPKGGRFRTVDIGEDTIAILEEYKRDLMKPDEVVDFSEAVKNGAEKKLPQWLFSIEGADLPMHPTSPTHFFRKFGERYNVAGFHPHMLRHTSASLSLTNGADYKSTADRLGHKDASILMKVYAHANDASIRAAGQAAREALKKKREEAEREKKEKQKA